MSDPIVFTYPPGPVVRLELPAALELQKLLDVLLAVLNPGLTATQKAAVEKLAQRIREAESRS